MFETRDELARSYAEAGLSEGTVRSLISMARPCVRLGAEQIDSEDQIQIGVSKLGGRPDLPRGWTWPQRPPYPHYDRQVAAIKHSDDDTRRNAATYWEDEAERAIAMRESEALTSDQLKQLEPASRPAPLDFIVQINLAELPPDAGLDSGLPNQGLVYLFYDSQQMPWGHEDGDAVGWQFLYFPGPRSELLRLEPPNTIQPFRPLPLKLKAGWSAVSLMSWGFPVSDDAEIPLVTAWEERRAELDKGTGYGHVHQLGGNPACIQSDMGKDPATWFLLLQIASDDKSEMMWGDAGNLYVWIRKDDLSARRFDKAELILECF